MPSYKLAKPVARMVGLFLQSCITALSIIS